jgi:hypothetical protein
MESNTKDAAEACRSVGDIVKTVLRIVLKDRTLKGSSVRGVYFVPWWSCASAQCEDAPYDATGLRST